MKSSLNLLEIHLLSKCNLKCIGCTSFSDYELEDEYNLDDDLNFLSIWAKRINVNSIALAGGEPTMHPDIIKAIYVIRELFPFSMINLVTNGSYLIKNPKIIETLHKVKHSCLTISNHEPTKLYTKKVKEFVLGLYDWKPCEFREDWLETSNQFYLELRNSEPFIEVFKGTYDNIMPHNSNPDAAFDNCCFHDSINYFKGNLYKCSPLQNLKRMLSDWGQENNEFWQPYLKYNPLTPNCSDDELVNFISKINQSESYCSMCPSNNMPTGKYIKRGQWKKIKIPIRFT